MWRGGDEVIHSHIDASDTLREHVASVDCWCHPECVEEGVYVHSDSDIYLHGDSDNLSLEDYRPDIEPVAQGDDCQ